MNNIKVKLNYIYTLFFQVFSLITPLITTPYISRIFSSEGIGQFSFSASVNSYFCMFAALGFSFYGQREIAKKQGDKEGQSKIFWELFICKIFFGVVASAICWLIIGFDFFDNYRILIKIMSLEILATTLNISYFFQGNEKFGIITLRDSIIKIIGIILIFCFVKKPEDLWLYALCNVGTSLVSALSLWLNLKKSIVFVNVRSLNPLIHLIPSIKLFIPTIAISLYTILDKTLIGFLIPGNIEIVLPDGSIDIKNIADIENGYYAQSEKIIKMALLVLSSLGTVMMPRNAKELEDGNEDRFFSNIKGAINYVFFIGAPMMFGVLAISSNFAPWFFGDGFEKVPILMMIFSLIVLPAGLGNVLGQQCLIPKGEDNKYIFAYVTSGIINVILNIILIPRLLSYGAAIASVVAEWCAPMIMIFWMRKQINFLDILKENWKVFLSSMIMFIVVYITSTVLSATIVSTFLLLLEGIIVYVALLIVFKCKMVYDAMESIRNYKKRGGDNGDK